MQNTGTLLMVAGIVGLMLRFKTSQSLTEKGGK